MIKIGEELQLGNIGTRVLERVKNLELNTTQNIIEIKGERVIVSDEYIYNRCIPEVVPKVNFKNADPDFLRSEYGFNVFVPEELGPLSEWNARVTEFLRVLWRLPKDGLDAATLYRDKPSNQKLHDCLVSRGFMYLEKDPKFNFKVYNTRASDGHAAWLIMNVLHSMRRAKISCLLNEMPNDAEHWAAAFKAAYEQHFDAEPTGVVRTPESTIITTPNPTVIKAQQIIVDYASNRVTATDLLNVTLTAVYPKWRILLPQHRHDKLISFARNNVIANEDCAKSEAA